MAIAMDQGQRSGRWQAPDPVRGVAPADRRPDHARRPYLGRLAGAGLGVGDVGGPENGSLGRRERSADVEARGSPGTWRVVLPAAGNRSRAHIPAGCPSRPALLRPAPRCRPPRRRPPAPTAGGPVAAQHKRARVRRPQRLVGCSISSTVTACGSRSSPTSTATSRRWRRSCATWRPPAPRRPSSRATQPSDRSRPTRWSCSCPSGERGIWVRDNCERNLIEMFDSVYRQTGAAHKAGVIWSGRQLTTQRVDRPHLASGSKAERPPLDQDRRPLPRPSRTPP